MRHYRKNILINIIKCPGQFNLTHVNISGVTTRMISDWDKSKLHGQLRKRYVTFMFWIYSNLEHIMTDKFTHKLIDSQIRKKLWDSELPTSLSSVTFWYFMVCISFNLDCIINKKSHKLTSSLSSGCLMDNKAPPHIYPLSLTHTL